MLEEQIVKSVREKFYKCWHNVSLSLVYYSLIGLLIEQQTIIKPNFHYLYMKTNDVTDK